MPGENQSVGGIMIFQRLRTRMIAHIIWIVTAVTCITFYFVEKLNQESLRDHLGDDAVGVAEIVENFLIKAMQQKGPAWIGQLLPELSRLHHIKRIRILLPSGRVASSSMIQEKGEIFRPGRFVDFVAGSTDVLTYHVSDGRSTTFFRWKKLKNETACQRCHGSSQILNGILLVETTDKLSPSVFKSDYLLLAGIALGVIVLLSAATIALFIRSVDRPIQGLKATMDALERGDFSSRTESYGHNELDQLALGMNAMAEKLQKAREHLVEHHRQELVQAEALAKIGQLSAGLAHEIKNPISGIVFAVNSILREKAPSDNRREILEEIVRQANRVEQILDALLTFGRQSRLERFPTDLNAMIERILLFIRQQPDMNLIKTESDLDSHLPEVLVDPKQMEQMLLNLVINAVQAMPEGGRLTVQTRYEASGMNVSVAVRDSGVGIPEKAREKIFLPFYTTKVRGVGLGLVLCKEVVTRHNGEIFFESEAGKGTAFIVRIPVGSLDSL
jgi:signal transduction histidine kinase